MVKLLSLNGDWTFYRDEEPSVHPALVPGCVHMDLLRIGEIEDPFYRDNESRLYWIGETDWTYERQFTAPPEFLEASHVVLRCHGLDTLATVTVNGTVIGSADNMYRTWLFDVKPHLNAGENTIAIRFAAPMPFLRQQDAERGKLPAWVGNERLNGGAWLRKEPCNFGWDWGPRLPTSGIWRDIELIAYDVRLSDVEIRQQHADGRVTLNVRAETEGAHNNLTLRAQVSYDGQPVGGGEQALNGGGARLSLSIDQPKLWWISGMGDQPLYDVQVQLVGADGAVMDEQTRRIGLRTLTLDRHPDQWGESFQFAINGIPFFAKGANWIPADTFVPRLTHDDYERLIRDTVAANMNMLRVWGGGVYEQDVFYEMCDQYGVAVWQDFIFACGTYPTFDEPFMANVRAEAIDNVRRLRHHPSITLWCGNNEMEQGLVGDEWTDRTMSWDDYDKLFNALLPEVVAANDPDRPYWPCSPHTSVGDRVHWNSPDSGDTHLWAVWHGREPFEWYRTCLHRFCSEFGFQSFPEPASLANMIEPEDRNITSYMMEYRQRSGIGNSTIIHYLLEWFRLPSGFENGIWLSQILQGMAIKYAVEHWRRNMPRTMGTLYWQLNDCWPGPSWSSIDSLGRWKALHYMAKRFYAPLLISGLEHPETRTVDVHVTSDLAETQNGTVRWQLVTAEGSTVAKGETPVTAPPYQDTLVATLDLSDALNTVGVRDALIMLELVVNGEVVSDNLVLFARPKHLALRDPNIRVEAVNGVDGTDASATYRVTLSAEHPALWVWLSTDDGAWKYSDNFFHLLPDAAHTVEITTGASVTIDDVREKLRVQSLIDTYEEAPVLA